MVGRIPNWAQEWASTRRLQSTRGRGEASLLCLDIEQRLGAAHSQARCVEHTVTEAQHRTPRGGGDSGGPGKGSLGSHWGVGAVFPFLSTEGPEVPCRTPCSQLTAPCPGHSVSKWFPEPMGAQTAGRAWNTAAPEGTDTEERGLKVRSDGREALAGHLVLERGWGLSLTPSVPSSSRGCRAASVWGALAGTLHRTIWAGTCHPSLDDIS